MPVLKLVHCECFLPLTCDKSTQICQFWVWLTFWICFEPKTLRHPNLCVANLLGEACPIFQKFSDFSLFLGGRLKPLCLHESWRQRGDALKMECCWSGSLSLAFLACSTLRVWTTWAARCKQRTWLPRARNKTVRLNQAESAWFSLTLKTHLNGLKRIWADLSGQKIRVFSGFYVFGGTGINEK